MSFKLGALGDFKNGANYPKDSYGSGFKIVNVKDLFKGHFIDFEELEELKPEVLKNPKQYQVLDGDLLFTRSSLVQSGTGMVAMAHHPHDFVVYCGFIIRFRPNKDLVDPTYLTYLLRSKKYREIFINLASQTTITNINQKTLSEFEVDLPDLSIQKTISSLLKQYDDKIELNSRMNKTLEEMAQAIFKRWFVDFEFPDENGIPYKSSGGKMVESELGLIPEGWRVGKINDIDIVISDYVANGSFASLKENVKLYDDRKEFALFIRNTDLKVNFSGARKYVDKKSYEFLSKTKLFGGELIISNVGDVGSVFLCPRFDEPMTLGNNVIMIKSNTYPLMNIFLYRFFKSEIGQHDISSITSGSVQLKFNKTDFRNLKFVFPNILFINKYIQMFEIIENSISFNNRQKDILAKLRDTLLPKLMSGEIRVPVTEETK